MQGQIFIDKMIQIQNQASKITCAFNMKLAYMPSTREVNISRAICEIHSRGLRIQNSHFFYQDFSRCIYVFFGTYPFPNQVYLKCQYFPNSIVKLRYRKINQIQKESKKKVKEFPIKKPKERTIGEVMASVKKWKQLHNKLDGNGKKMYTMDSAAKELGIQKKTLDDYNYQLQLGESYSFDFQKHKDDKIGFLRQFIKKKKEELKYIHNTDNYWALSDKDSDDKDKKSQKSQKSMKSEESDN